ncbi:MAG: trans-aconitate methyltransferase [Clostridiales bacterium]|nr:trans-aconitate methyltransferase [Clostridiales bacterium]
MTKDEKWGFTEYETNDTLPPEDYFDILSACASRFAIWETVYYHAMPGVDALIEWVKGARLRPFLCQMNEAMQKKFEAELFQKTLPLYRPMKNGEIIFRFRRLFFIAYK